MRIAVPDLVTNSYFPALAAEELGLYRAEGVDAHVDLLAPALGAMAALKSGDVEFVVTGAHTTLTAFPGWQGAKLAVAVAQGTPWLLVLRSDVAAVRGDVGAVKGLRIGAAPGPDAALRRLLAEAGIDLERDTGAGRFTFAALVTTEALIDRDPEAVAAVVRGIVSAQHRLREDPGRATEVGRRRFPPAAADMIAALVERDLPFYDPVIDEDAVRAMSEFSIALGLIQEKVPYNRVVATRFRDLWRGR